jgi:hypothetical protein
MVRECTDNLSILVITTLWISGLPFIINGNQTVKLNISQLIPCFSSNPNYLRHTVCIATMKSLAFVSVKGNLKIQTDAPK